MEITYRFQRHRQVLNFCGGGLVARSCQTLATAWTVAHQAPLSTGFPRQAYWSKLPFPTPGDLSDPGIVSGSPALEADSLPSELKESYKLSMCAC